MPVYIMRGIAFYQKILAPLGYGSKKMLPRLARFEGSFDCQCLIFGCGNFAIDGILLLEAILV